MKPLSQRRLEVWQNSLEIHYTPKHGNGLNIAEIELSILTKQCLGNRIPDFPRLESVTKLWAQERNTHQKGVDWQFTLRRCTH